MICDNCREEASGCPDCGREISVKNDGTMRIHKRDVARVSPRCPASGRRGPKYHPACVGCTCQCREPGSWKGGK